MKKLRIGHIGWWSRDNGPGYETVAWCDVNEDKLRQAQEKAQGISLYRDYRDMLRQANLDAVIISTPNFVHAEQAVDFLNAGVHVFLEKPMGVNAAECDAVLLAAIRNRRCCVIDFEMRVSVFAQRVRQLIADGRYGALRGIELVHHRGCWLEEGNGIWRTRPERSGGLFFMEGIHAVDIFRLFAGELTSVQSVAAPKVLPQYRFTDNVCAHFFSATGVVATLLTSHTHSAATSDSDAAPALGHDMRMILTLERGSIAADFWKPAITINRFEEYPAGTGAVRVVPERVEDYAGIGMKAFAHDIGTMRRTFIERLAGGLEPIQSTLDAWKTHRACLAAEQSLREDFRRIDITHDLPAGTEDSP